MPGVPRLAAIPALRKQTLNMRNAMASKADNANFRQTHANGEGFAAQLGLRKFRIHVRGKLITPIEHKHLSVLGPECRWQ